jgi:hypothetical protein
MPPPELLRQITSTSCPFVFRIVDRDRKNPGAGTAVLVSDAGFEHGFALTCWHNVDWDLVHVDDWKRQEVVTLPPRIVALPADASDLMKAPGRRVELMGRASNPRHDLAVLRVSHAVIKAFHLRPAPISFHVRPGAPVIVRGLDRTWLAASLRMYRGRVPDMQDPFMILNHHLPGQRAFMVRLEEPWHRGMSGGAVFDAEHGALIGIATGLLPEFAVVPAHFETGYAAAMQEAAESWTTIRRHCDVVEPGATFPPWPLPPRIVHPLPPAPHYERREELEALRGFWTGPGAGGVLSLIGIGGAGKTSIAERFLHELTPSASPNAPRGDDTVEPKAMFAWSFYQAPDPQQCVEALLRYLDGDRRDAAPPLADVQSMIARRENARVLVVLDGLERLQEMAPLGRLNEGAAPLRLFLQGCANGTGGIWVVVTSQLPLSDLAAWQERAYRPVEVDQLSVDAAHALLRGRGVKGTAEQIDGLLREFGRHALTLDYLGTLLTAFYDGDPAGVAELSPLPLRASTGSGTSEADAQARRLTRLFVGYEQRLDGEEVAALQAISVFRVPVDVTALAAFSWKPSTPAAGATPLPKGLRLRQVLARLRELHLVQQHTDAGGAHRYSVHPAVSQYFYDSLEEDARLAHLGASEYLSREVDARRFQIPARGAVRTRGAVRVRGGAGESHPSDPAVLALLEEAIYHMLQAGLVAQALELYRRRLGGFAHLAKTLRQPGRGHRLTAMFLDHAVTHGDFAGLAQLREDHERYRAALDSADPSR